MMFSMKIEFSVKVNNYYNTSLIIAFFIEIFLKSIQIDKNGTFSFMKNFRCIKR